VSIRDRIISLHGEGTLRLSALRIGDGAGVFEVAMAGRGYRTAIEIGTYRGCAAAAMAQHCERVITIDLRHGKVEMEGGFNRAEFWASLGLHNVEFIQVTDDAEKARVIAPLDFDFAFIDGAHDSLSVCNDFALVKRCSRVLFHDYDTSGRPNKQHVRNLVRELPSHEIKIMGAFALWAAA
jgi:predicted O-methyltransferase YrrM